MKKNITQFHAAFKVAGIVAVVAMLSFAMMGCPTEDNSDSWGNPPQELVGTWGHTQKAVNVTIGGNGTFATDESIYKGGAFKTDGSKFRMISVHDDILIGTWSLNAPDNDELTLKFDDPTLENKLGGLWDKVTQ